MCFGMQRVWLISGGESSFSFVHWDCICYYVTHTINLCCVPNIVFFSGGADVTITKIFFLIRFIPLYICRNTTLAIFSLSYLFNSLSEFFESTYKSAKSKLHTFKVLIFLTFIDIFATFLDFRRK